MGKFFDYLQTSTGFLIVVVLPVFLFFLFHLVQFFRVLFEYQNVKNRIKYEQERGRTEDLIEAEKRTQEQEQAQQRAALEAEIREKSDEGGKTLLAGELRLARIKHGSEFLFFQFLCTHGRAAECNCVIGIHCIRIKRSGSQQDRFRTCSLCSGENGVCHSLRVSCAAPIYYCDSTHGIYQPFKIDPNKSKNIYQADYCRISVYMLSTVSRSSDLPSAQ